ncbi:MAG: hypothetical protein KF903_05600 [Dokdonella sp.]|uniref:hypothetical protein n=1 Tax=Dokdonella sp. TaxID=2291710 RepID=UPI0025BCD1B0|nr:hypothetical protein [Dokdonella sp.]MBX3700457.1 hypothetical protein [Dokdonella sp.]
MEAIVEFLGIDPVLFIVNGTILALVMAPIVKRAIKRAQQEEYARQAARDAVGKQK